jgi:hypothetical protein
MTFKIGAGIESLANSVLNNGTVKAVSGNPIYTSLAISFMVVIIVMFVFYRRADANFNTNLLTVGFYSFFASMIFVYLNNRIILAKPVVGAVQPRNVQPVAQIPPYLPRAPTPYVGQGSETIPITSPLFQPAANEYGIF